MPLCSNPNFTYLKKEKLVNVYIQYIYIITRVQLQYKSESLVDQFYSCSHRVGPYMHYFLTVGLCTHANQKLSKSCCLDQFPIHALSTKSLISGDAVTAGNAISKSVFIA